MSERRLLLFAATVLMFLFLSGEIVRHPHELASLAGQSNAPTPAGIDPTETDAPGGEPVSADPSDAAIQADPERPINRGIPAGPYDPVLIQPPPFGRSIPPTNRRANDPFGEDVSITQSETTIATFGDTVVVGWNDGIGFVYPWETISGYGYSVDRGETWIDGGSVPNGDNAFVYGDPAVAVTRDGQWVFVSLDLGSPLGLAVNRARFVDGTLVWDPSVKFIDGGGMLDKEYIDYDSITDRLYMTYMKMSSYQGRLVYSNDGGATWSSPRTIGSGNGTTGYYPAAGIDGEVYASWLNGLGSPSAGLFCRYSSDGGQSWATSAVQVAQLGDQSHQPPQCYNRDFNVTFPAMSVDRSSGSHRGRAYFCWTDGAAGNFDVFLAYSDDKGQTWSAPIRLDDEQGDSEQFWPQVHVGPDGRVSAGWYDRRNAVDGNSLCDFYISQSVDGGVTWGPNRRLSDVSVAWCGVPANITPNFGDYIEVASDDRSVYGVWADARGGGPDVYVGRYDDRFLLAVTGSVGEQRSVFGGTGTAWYIPNETEFKVDPAPALDSQADLLVAGIGLGTLASPQETNGVFRIGGDAIHGRLQMVSPLGVVNGTFSIARSGSNGIDFQFSVNNSSGLSEVEFLPNSQVQATLMPAGSGLVNVLGTATMNQPLGPLVFSLSGQIHFDGAPGGQLAANQLIEESIDVGLGSALQVHTRATVVDDVTIDVPVLALGSNPPPLATVRAAPNPLEPSTRIMCTLSHPATGSLQIYSVDGRCVRTIAKGRFEPGPHEYRFDGKDNAGRRLGKGGYFIRFETDVVNVAGKLFVVN